MRPNHFRRRGSHATWCSFFALSYRAFTVTVVWVGCSIESTGIKLLLAGTRVGSAFLRLPWMELVLEDMRKLSSFHGSKLQELGDPVDNSHAWLLLIESFPAYWKQMVGAYTETTSAMDKYCVGKGCAKISTSHSFTCADCVLAGTSIAFPSSKALLAHQRKVHGKRNPLRCFLDGNHICPVCSCKFSSRTRALAHLTEKRNRGKHLRKTCGELLLEGRYMPLSDEVVSALDNLDKTTRAKARMHGNTQPLASFHAQRTLGRAIQPSRNPFGPMHRLNRKRSPNEIVFVCKRPKVM